MAEPDEKRLEQERVEKEVSAWDYLGRLPKEWFGFSFHRLMQNREDFYDLYSYVNEKLHRSAIVYYHSETHEYKLRVHIGLTEFCRIEYIAPNLEVMEQLLSKQFETMLRDMAEFNIQTISVVVKEKHILDWEYAKKLPEILEGFRLFVYPSKPVKSINGSYIVFDYSDFTIDSNFIIYYNVFRDEFFGEARIRKIPEMNYVFDSTELLELEEKLDANLVPRLQEIRQRAQEAEVTG